MQVGDPFVDAFSRISSGVRQTVEGLTPAQLCARPEGRGNSIAWLVWHLTRVQDDHISEVIPAEQLWTAEGWAERFNLPLDRSETGYGHDSSQVGAVTVEDPELLAAYQEAVAQRTVEYVRHLAGADLDRVVDERFDPPVSLGVRLVSVMEDDFQHLGQAGYVRGLVS